MHFADWKVQCYGAKVEVFLSIRYCCDPRSCLFTTAVSWRYSGFTTGLQPLWWRTVTMNGLAVLGNVPRDLVLLAVDGVHA